MKIPNIHIFFSIVCGIVFFLSSCVETQPEYPDEEERPFFRLASRSEDNGGRTYRLLFYKNEDFAYYGSGTYDIGKYDASSGASLRPRILNDDGSVNDTVSVNDHKKAYIQPEAGRSYQVVCVSPGVICHEDGGIDLNPNSDVIMMTEKEKMEIKGFGHYKITKTLIEPRSKIHLKFFKDKIFNGKKVKIDNVKIYGAGSADDRVTYYPTTNQVVFSEGREISVDITNLDNNTADSRDYIQIAESKSPVYVISAIYAPKNIVQNMIGNNSADYKDSNNIIVSFDLSQEGQDSGTVSLPITSQYPLLKPKYEYTYEFVIQKEYVQLIMKIQSDAVNDGWQSAVQGTQTIDDDYKITINVGTWCIADGGWTTTNLGNQYIN